MSEAEKAVEAPTCDHKGNHNPLQQSILSSVQGKIVIITSSNCKECGHEFINIQSVDVDGPEPKETDSIIKHA